MGECVYGPQLLIAHRLLDEKSEGRGPWEKLVKGVITVD
jgi:hypothetical protein